MATYSTIFFPGDFHGQRCLVGYIPWNHKELNMTDQLTLFFFHFTTTIKGDTISSDLFSLMEMVPSKSMTC